MHNINDLREIELELRRRYSDSLPSVLPIRANVLRDSREKHRYTQVQLSEKSGVHQTNISRMEQADNPRNTDPPNFECSALFAVASSLELEFEKLAIVPTNIVRSQEPLSRDDLCEQLLSVVFVRSLIKPEVRTDLRQFYYPCRLKRRLEGSDDDRDPKYDEFQAKDLFSFSCVDNEFVLIVGIAGQGKSILLRYLTAVSLSHPEDIPLFIELRNLDGASLIDTISRRLRQLGCFVDEKLTTLHTGNIILFLDAFDEVKETHRSELVKELAWLHEEFSSLRIIVSSRPNTTLADAIWVTKFDLLFLEPRDVPNVLRKYSQIDEANNLIERLDSPLGRYVRGVLDTPLMVILLVIHFRYSQSLPSSTTAFYKDLLDVLLRRHNLSDTGYKREITAGLDTHQLRQFFQCLSFLVERQFTDSSILRSDMEDVARKALSMLSLKCSVPAVLEDICSITNLIIEEYGSFRFIHKSIREFYAAAFVQQASEPSARNFYGAMLKKWEHWSGELLFLAIIDRYRYLRYFAIPDLKRCEPYNAKSVLEQFIRLELSGRRNTGKISVSLGAPKLFCLRGSMFVNGNDFKNVKVTAIEQCIPYTHVEEVKDLLRQHKNVTLDRANASGISVDAWKTELLFPIFAEILQDAGNSLREEYKRLNDELKSVTSNEDEFAV
jgi:transcriptional regulator with XRE-family HTH domain